MEATPSRVQISPSPPRCVKINCDEIKIMDLKTIIEIFFALIVMTVTSTVLEVLRVRFGLKFMPKMYNFYQKYPFILPSEIPFPVKGAPPSPYSRKTQLSIFMIRISIMVLFTIALVVYIMSKLSHVYQTLPQNQ